MILTPPRTTRASGAFLRLIERAGALSRGRAQVIVALLLPAILTVDWASGSRVSLGLAYTLLICFAAWTLGQRIGLLVMAVALSGLPVIHHAQIDMPFGTTDLWNMASRMVSMALLAIVVSALRDMVEMERWRAATDGLTGVLNTSAFHARMARAITRANAVGQCLVLLYMDLDGFKGVNDYHGHAAGNRVLRTFARAAAEAIRHDDLFARIGGDEFVALLTVPDGDHGEGTAETLHARLSAILAETGFAVTCSMGAVVVAADHDTGSDALIGLADRLMYEVKRNGRNALRIARLDRDADVLRGTPPRRPIGQAIDNVVRLGKGRRAA